MNRLLTDQDPGLFFKLPVRRIAPPAEPADDGCSHQYEKRNSPTRGHCCLRFPFSEIDAAKAKGFCREMTRQLLCEELLRLRVFRSDEVTVFAQTGQKFRGLVLRRHRTAAQYKKKRNKMLHGNPLPFEEMEPLRRVFELLIARLCIWERVSVEQTSSKRMPAHLLTGNFSRTLATSLFRNPRRGMFEWLFRTPRFRYFNRQNCGRFFLAVRPWFPHIFHRHCIVVSEFGVGPPLHDAPADLRLRVGIIEIHNGKGNARLTQGIFTFYRTMFGADQEQIPLSAYPNRGAVGRSVGHDRRKEGKIRPVDQLFQFIRYWGPIEPPLCTSCPPDQYAFR